MTTARIFIAANNDGTGREDYHVTIEGARHNATFGAFRTLREAQKIAAEKESQEYWDTGEGSID